MSNSKNLNIIEKICTLDIENIDTNDICILLTKLPKKITKLFSDTIYEYYDKIQKKI